MEEATALDAATRRYKRTEAAHDISRKAAIEAVVAALRAGMAPTEAAQRSPFTSAYVRRIAREHGIEPAPRGPKPKPAK